MVDLFENLIVAYRKGLPRDLAADYAGLTRESVHKWFRQVEGEEPPDELTEGVVEHPLVEIVKGVFACRKARAMFVAETLGAATNNERLKFIMTCEAAEQAEDAEGRAGTASERVATLLGVLKDD